MAPMTDTKADDLGGHRGRGIPYRGEHRQAAKRATADIEGHSMAAEFPRAGMIERQSPRVCNERGPQLRRLTSPWINPPRPATLK
jgi:hypothetical protein